MDFAQAISSLPDQLRQEPNVQNADRLQLYSQYIVCGMGGSNIAPSFVQRLFQVRPITTHRDYGLPNLDPSVRERMLVVLSSYSGETEETLDAYMAAGDGGFPRAVLASTGELLEHAENDTVPHVVLRDVHAPPRFALGHSMTGLLALMQEHDELVALQQAAGPLESRMEEYRAAGGAIAAKLAGTVPLIYASTPNYPLGALWKIDLTETARVPAFCNVVPEMNHHELAGFQHAEKIGTRWSLVFLRDASDDPRTLRRMDLVKQVAAENTISSIDVPLTGESASVRLLGGALIGAWTAHALGANYRTGEDTSPIERFKELLKGN